MQMQENTNEYPFLNDLEHSFLQFIYKRSSLERERKNLQLFLLSDTQINHSHSFALYIIVSWVQKLIQSAYSSLLISVDLGSISYPIQQYKTKSELLSLIQHQFNLTTLVELSFIFYFFYFLLYSRRFMIFHVH
jgi:hypothetical protein